jgi:MFS family permease
MAVADAPSAPAARPFDRRFVTVVAAALSYFVSLGILIPVLPRYIEGELGGDGKDVGIAVGAFAVTAALLRPWVGVQGDRRGKRILLVAGAAVAGVATLGYGLAGGLATLVVFRLLAGAGEAAAFVGAATTAQDLAPEDRRGQAASLFSIAVYGGLAFGPVIGDWTYTEHGATAAWVAAATAAFLASAIALLLPEGRPARPPPPPEGRRRWLHPAGIRPGVVLALSAAGFAGFASFVPLYVDDIGVDAAGPVFFTYGAIVLAVRIVFSRLPDILGTRRGPALALVLQGAGLLTMGLWASPVGLYVATAVYAAGVSILYPALFPAVVGAAPEGERSQAIATFTLFFDLSQGLGAPLLGIVVTLTAERGAFLGAAVLSVLALAIHLRAHLPAAAAVPEPCPPPVPGE